MRVYLHIHCCNGLRKIGKTALEQGTRTRLVTAFYLDNFGEMFFLQKKFSSPYTDKARLNSRITTVLNINSAENMTKTN